MKSIFEQTGWQRPHPYAICQNQEILLKVKEYTFDLTNEKFLKYFSSRTGYCLKFDSRGNEMDSFYWEKLQSFFQTGTETHTKITLAKLQDCWELFTQQDIEQNLIQPLLF